MTTRLPTLGAPPKAGIRRWLDGSFGDVVRRLNAATLHRRRRWLDVREDFGAKGDGSSDDTVPFRRWLAALVEASNSTNVGVTGVIPPGSYQVGNLPWVSFSSNTITFDATGADDDFLTDYARGDIHIHADGALITHTGDGSLFRFWGSTLGTKLVWREGTLTGSTTDTEALFKVRDGNSFSIKPRKMRSAIRHVLLQNWLNWTENAEIGGSPVEVGADVLAPGGADVVVECQGGDDASLHDHGATGQNSNAGENSFARLRVDDVHGNGRIYTVWARGNVYEGWLGRFSGNAKTCQAHIRQQRNMTRTVVSGIHHEQGDSKDEWAASTAYSLGDDVSGEVSNYSPTNLQAHSQDTLSLNVRMHFEVTTAGTSGASEPDWDTANAVGETVTDGTVVWTNRGFSAGYIVDAEGATGSTVHLPLVRDVVWQGGFQDARGLGGHNRGLSHLHGIHIGGAYTFQTSVTIGAAATGTLIENSDLATNDVFLICAGSTDNTILGAAIFKRRSSTTAVALGALHETGCTFAVDGSNNVTLTNNLAGSRTVLAKALRLGNGMPWGAPANQ